MRVILSYPSGQQLGMALEHFAAIDEDDLPSDVGVTVIGDDGKPVGLDMRPKPQALRCSGLTDEEGDAR